MKLNLDMAKKRLDWHMLATKFLVARNGNLSHQMKLNLDMARKRLDWHTLATKFLVASNGNLSHQMKLNLDMAKKRLDWHTLAATRKSQPVLKHLSLPRYHSTIKRTVHQAMTFNVRVVRWIATYLPVFLLK
jgi:hypothetical protein